MSVRNSYCTSDYIPWDTMLALVHKLYRDGDYRMSLLLGCGCFFGLRISDLLTLNWAMLLDGDEFVVTEKKTKKRREIQINSNFQKHIQDCYNSLNVKDRNEECFISQKHCVYSIQRINVKFKEIKKKYGLRIEHFSTHSMRKTFGRKIYESASANGNGDMALLKLSELFNHSDIRTTKIYLGIRKEELKEAYVLLDF